MRPAGFVARGVWECLAVLLVFGECLYSDKLRKKMD